MQWFAGIAFGVMYPGLTLDFQLSDTLGYWLAMFVVIAMIGSFAVSYHTMRLNLKESYRIQLERERLQSELKWPVRCSWASCHPKARIAPVLTLRESVCLLRRSAVTFSTICIRTGTKKC
jgi:hypothetical protein